jgi:hypothetical protein
MSKAGPTLNSTVPVSKLDTTDYARVPWKVAYRQARAMIRDRARFGIGASYAWAIIGHLRRRFGAQHLRRRFGAQGWRVV